LCDCLTAPGGDPANDNPSGCKKVFEDRYAKGFTWNNFMLQTWIDHEGVTHTVGKDYERNLLLCGLKNQPENIKKIITETIDEGISLDKNISMVGVRFLKFCGKHELLKLAENPNPYVEVLNAKYN
jgi:hypothetical protein